jgi:adenylate cyclase
MPNLDKSRKSFLRGALLAAVGSVCLMCLIVNTRPIQWLEEGSYDARTRLAARPGESDKRIVVIDVDNASYHGLQDKLGRWPWSRRVWTEVLRYVSRGQPKAVGFDVMFGGQETPEVDQEFAKVIHNAGNVVLAYSFSSGEIELGGGDTNLPKLDLLTREATGVTPNAIGELKDTRKILPNVPLDHLANAAAGLGTIDAALDSDGAARRVAIAVKLQDPQQARSFRSFDLRIADQVTNRPNGLVERQGTFAVKGDLKVPVDDRGRMLILWHGDAQHTYQRIPIWQVIASIYPQQFPYSEHSYKPDYFKDKIVLIAASAAGSYDAHPTPFGDAEPGFIVHAAAIDNLLHNQAVRLAPGWFKYAAIILFAAVGAGLLIFVSSASMSAAVFIAVLLIYTAVSYLSFSRVHISLPLVAPMLSLVAAFASTAAIRYATTGRELRRTRGTLDRYISPALVNYVLDNLDTINLAGEKRELTIFFSDVRNFTTLTESADPMELIALLDEYLAEMTDVIFKYEGITDKFIGDGILAYWGAFTPGKNHALLAAQAALEMLERLKKLNERWAAQGKKTLAIGIGINTGDVIFGNLGSGKKIEFTVIGDPVNVASRLEGLNKDFHTSIIISEQTHSRIAEYAVVRDLGCVKVKGKTLETQVLELQGLDLTGKNARTIPCEAAGTARDLASATHEGNQSLSSSQPISRFST